MFWANLWLFIKELFEKDLGIPIREIPEEEYKEKYKFVDEKDEDNKEE